MTSAGGPVLESTRAARTPRAGSLAVPSDHELTVVIPAFNEESRLPQTLDGLSSYLNAWGVDYRVLVVDDGSRDRTATLTEPRGRRFSTIRLPQQSGKGAAIRAGLLAATGHVIAFTDADLPYDLDALKTGFETVRGGDCDVVFGARDLAASTCRARRRLMRTLATTVFREIVRCLVSREVTDTQCGLKVFSRNAAVEIFSRTTINGFAFDAEVVFLTHRLDLPFRRVPVTLINEYSSTLSLSRHALPMLMDVLRLRARAWRGEYELDAPPRLVTADDPQSEQRSKAA